MNVVDLLAILPYFVSFVMEELKDTQVPVLITLVLCDNNYCGSGQQRSRRRFPGDRESWEGDSADQSDAHPQGFQGPLPQDQHHQHHHPIHNHIHGYHQIFVVIPSSFLINLPYGESQTSHIFCWLFPGFGFSTGA